jgi:hypothetical protein
MPLCSLPRSSEWTYLYPLLRISWFRWVLLIVKSFADEFLCVWIFHFFERLKNLLLVIDFLPIEFQFFKVFSVIFHSLVKCIRFFFEILGFILVEPLVDDFLSLNILLIFQRSSQFQNSANV